MPYVKTSAWPPPGANWQIRRDQLAKCRQIEQHIAELRRQIKAETQFNRQVQLNLRIKAAEKELALAGSQKLMVREIGIFTESRTWMICVAKRIEPFRKIKKVKAMTGGEPHAKASVIIITFHGLKIKLAGNSRQEISMSRSRRWKRNWGGQCCAAVKYKKERPGN